MKSKEGGLIKEEDFDLERQSMASSLFAKSGKKEKGDANQIVLDSLANTSDH